MIKRNTLTNICIECGHNCDRQAKRCKVCAMKELFKNPENHPRYKHGQSRTKEYRTIYRRTERTNINTRLSCNLGKRIWDALKGNCKSKHTEELIGCSIDYLKIHLEKQFSYGMTWLNYGKWHVDHIRPCASFDLSKKSEQLKCFHYSNLQPLWAVENLRKNKKEI
jgi:hypothetical protein